MYIIAESASNHNGSVGCLTEMAEASKNAGADFFTFQILKVEEFAVKEHPKFEFFQKLEIREEDWLQFFDRCKQVDIALIPCVLDIASFEFCFQQGFRFFKIHGTDIVNKSLLETIVSKNDCRVLLETQYATNFEINFALQILKDHVVCILTGFSNFPTEFDELGLNTLDALREDYTIDLGFADHTTDITGIPLMALAKGCVYFEKHITLSRSQRNPDWQVSLEPEAFKVMANTLRLYERALGRKVKHPGEVEKKIRNIVFKKQIAEGIFKRSENHSDYLSSQFQSFEKKKVIVALIARLKSKRLPLKVLKPLGSDILIHALYKRLSLSKNIQDVFLTTSYLPEDAPLLAISKEKGMKCFTGHPVSVIDRMLSLVWQEKAGAVFRVTGDNPFTDPYLIDEMVKLYLENGLDYVRVNNVPTGVSAELYSAVYLWNLYLRLENPNTSEYLTWYVLNDKEARKGSIDVECSKSFLEKINLSVDYPEDYQRALSLLEKTGKHTIEEVSLADIIHHLDMNVAADPDKMVKLPENQSIKYSEYMDLKYNNNYTVRKKIIIP